MGLNGKDDQHLDDETAPDGVDAASWREFQQRVQRRRFKSLAERALEKSEAARRDLEALQLTLDEARQLRPGAQELRDLEAVARAATGSFRPHRPSRASVIGGTLIFLMLMGAAALATWSMSRAGVRADAAASLQVDSAPAGATVSVDGTRRGTTPVSLHLPPGRHELLIESAGRQRRSVVTLRAGADMVHAVEFGDTAPETATALPGDATRAAGQVAAALAPSAAAAAPQVDPAAAATGGWVMVSSPFPLTVQDRNGRVVGTSAMRRIPLPAGNQQVELANADLGFSSRQNVRVDDGATVRVQVNAPSGSLSLNATPWADVSIDGRALGETPLGDLTETIGDHQVEFSHPQFGTRRITVRVTLKEPTRVSVDMRVP